MTPKDKEDYVRKILKEKLGVELAERKVPLCGTNKSIGLASFLSTVPLWSLESNSSKQDFL